MAGTMYGIEFDELAFGCFVETGYPLKLQGLSEGSPKLGVHSWGPHKGL